MKKAAGLATTNPKVLRLLRRPWNVLISERGLLFPKSLEDHKKYFLKHPEINIKEKSVYLSDEGRTAVSHMLDVLCSLPEIRNAHTRNEIHTCFMKEYEDVWCRAIDSGLVDEIEEFLPKLLASLKIRIRRRRLYARLTGVRMEVLQYVEIGRVKLRPFDEKSSLRTFRNKTTDDYYDNDVVPFIQKNFEKGLCLEAEYEANAEKSMELFNEDCKNTISVLRLIVCLWVYDKIHLVKVPVRLWADATSPSRPMLMVDLADGQVSLHWGSNTDSNGPMLNPENLDTLRKSWFWDDLCRILASESRNELEEVIVTGIKWIGDAQNDSDISSEFVKYWTCLEGAFTGDTERTVTDNLARSISVLLVFGGYHFFEVSEFDRLYANIKKLYAIRSDIIHRGRSKRLTGAHLTDACKYSTFVTFALLGLRSQGYTTRHEIQLQVARIYAQTRHARSKDKTTT